MTNEETQHMNTLTAKLGGVTTALAHARRKTKGLELFATVLHWELTTVQHVFGSSVEARCPRCRAAYPDHVVACPLSKAVHESRWQDYAD